MITDKKTIMEIPFHRPHITGAEIDGVVDSLKSGWLTMGPKTRRFEEEFSRYVGSREAVALNSCTAAMHLALKAIGLKAGDEVIVPDVTFTATAEVVTYFGAVPVVVDVEEQTHNIDVGAVERALSPRTRAIIPVHYAGQPCDMDEIISLAADAGVKVVEDAAHAVPARYKGRLVGALGDITCFSFYATKTLSTGEGGMLTTENPEWADRARTLRLHGISKDAWKRYTREGSWHYEVVEAGYKYNMTDIQAALGLAQLGRVEAMLEKRADVARRYTGAFSGSELISTPVVRPERSSAWHLYVIKLNTGALDIDRARFIDELASRGVSTSVHFIPLHRHSFYKDTFNLDAAAFPVSERVYERMISLPIYPDMTAAEVEYVIENVLTVAREHKR